MTNEEVLKLIKEAKKLDKEGKLHKVGGKMEIYKAKNIIPEYSDSLDSLVPVWEKLDIEHIVSFPQSYPKIRFTISKHISQDKTKSWTGKGDSIQEAACIATAKAIKELNNG